MIHRLLAALAAAAALGQSFVVENRPGGGAIVGTDLVAKSAADGYTLLMMSNTHTVNESLIRDKPFQLMRDFVPVAPVNYSDLLMVVAGELFKAMAGVDIVHVPYKGSSGARTDILGGQVQMMFDAITTMAPNVRAGKLKALGTSGKARSSVLPDVPTVSEAGVAGYEAVIWLGIMAPAATPKPIVERLNAEITKAANAPEMKEAWGKQGAVAMSMSPDEFARFMRDDIEKWARIVRISGAKPDQ